jgi:hypothetical protein
MAKAVLAASRPSGAWYVAQVYADGTNMQNVANPPSGQLLLKWRQGYEPSVNDDLDAETICVGLAFIISTTNINWTPVKQAIN